ncbi:MAG: hypothetical protein IK108_03635 [Clostridia bacterium]|nr:hypothetical protein [Clostridia bacterium]
MGTKAKLSTKVLSIFLSVLMAASCISVALPSLAPKAFAATAEQTAWQDLADAFTAAFNGGYMSTKDWSSIASSGGTVTITDGTTNGYAYNIVAALGALLSVSRGDAKFGEGKHNSELISEITATLAADYDVVLNTYQQNFLNTVLDTTGIYGQYSPASIWNGPRANLEANLTAQTITITATREETAAILSDFESIDDLAAAEYKIVKSYSITVNAEAQECESNNGSEIGAYYVNSAVTAAPAAATVAAAKTQLVKIKAYLDYVGSDAFKPKFEAWYNNGGLVNNASLYNYSTVEINQMYHDYGAVYAPVATGDLAFREEYIGESVFETHKAFADAAHDALAVVSYKDYVAWLVNAAPYPSELIPNTRNRDDYQTTNPESIEAVIAQANTFKSAMSDISSENTAILKNLFPGYDPAKGYNVEDSSTYYANFDNFIKYLSSLLYNYYLQEIKAAANVLLNNGAGTTYTFSNETSKFFKLLSNSVSGYQTGTDYVLTSDSQIDRDKTYYVRDAVYTYAATEDEEVDGEKRYFTNWAQVESPVQSGLSGYYEDVEVFTYALTEDDALAENKTYYTLDGGVYTAVEEPAAENLGTYYERTGSYHTYQLTSDTTLNAVKKYYVQNSVYTVVTAPSKAYISTYAERTLDHYNYVQTADTVLVGGKTYYTSAGVKIEEPREENLSSYYEIKYNAVAEPVRSYLFDYYEKTGSYYGLKGVGEQEYIEANYDTSYSKTSDTAVDPDKTYYTYNETTGAYTPVAGPVAANLGDYYERAQCPIDDTDLAALYTFFSNAVTMIGNARSYGVNVENYFDETFEQQIVEMANALHDEQISRGRITDAFLQAYQPVADKMAGYIFGGASIQQLYDDIKWTEAKYSTISGSYSWFANDARGKAVKGFLSELYNEIYDRIQAQYAEIKREYDEKGSAQNIQTVFQLRQNMQRLYDLKASDGVYIREFIAASGSYGTGKVTGSNKLGARTSGNLTRGVNWSWLTTATNYINGLNGVYSTVNANKFTKGNIERLPKDSDMLRTVGAGADKFTAYFTTNGAPSGGKSASVAGTLTKLDNFLTNSNFTALLGADELGLGITTLGQYIKYILATKLFTDEMVNTLVGLLFPMLTDLFEITIVKTITDLSPMDMGSFNVDNLSGTLRIYANGASNGGHTSKTFEQLTHDLGANIYPKWFGQHLIDNGFSVIGNDIKGADKGWTKYRYDDNGNQSGAKDPTTGEYLYKADFKTYLEKHPNIKYDWGIDSIQRDSITATANARYERFCTVLGVIFGSALPLLKCLFGTTNFGGRADNAAVAWCNPVRYKIGITVSADINVHNLKAQLEVNYLDLYETLWIPVMEALGINGDLMGYTFAGVNSFQTGDNNTDRTALVHALLDPVWRLIDKLATAPVTSILKLLPNLCFHLMNGSVNNLMQRHVVFHVWAEDADLQKGDDGGVGSSIIAAIGGLLSEKIAGAINIKEAFDLGEKLVLEDMLGFSLKDINTVLAGVLGMINEDAVYKVTVGSGDDAHDVARTNLPGIGTGKVACMYKSISNTYGSAGKYTTYGDKVENFYSRNGNRIYVTANTEVLFYALFEWVFRAAQTKGGIADILDFVAGLSGSSLGDKIPQLVFSLVEGIESSDQAFAALIELLNEPEYSVSTFDWYMPEDHTTNWTATPFTYLTYNNKWTDKKATYVYENVDNIVNAVVNMITPETLEPFDGDVNVWLDRLINSMFNNEGIMNVIEIVVKLGQALESSPGIVKMLRQQITGDPQMNLYYWYNVWGYLYREEVTLGNNQFLAYNVQNNQVYVYEAQPIKKDVETVTLQSTNTMSSTATYTWKIVQAYAVAPNETIPWQINGTVMSAYNGKPYNDKYGPYKNLFSNLRWTEAETSENGDLLYTWEVKLTSDIIGHLKHNGTTLRRTGTPGSYTGYYDEGTSYGIGSWYPLIDGSEMDDLTSLNARAVFSAVFSELAQPLSSLLNFILCGKDLYLFGNTEATALTIQGYSAYNNAILPLMEALGVYDLKTLDQFKTLSAKNGFDYLVNKLFEALDNLLTDERDRDENGDLIYYKVDASGNYVLEDGHKVVETDSRKGKTFGKGAFQKLIDVMPHLYYFLQSDGLTTIVKNLPTFVWQLLDTLRPVANIDVDNIVHTLVCRIMKYSYNAEGEYAANDLTAQLLDLIGIKAAPVTGAATERDAEKVAAIFDFSVKHMTLAKVWSLLQGLTGLKLQPLTYALEGMVAYAAENDMLHACSYSATQDQEYWYTSFKDPISNQYKTYTLNFEGGDTITVTLAALIDILKYEGNAAALDKLAGTVSNLLPGAQNLLTGEGVQGLIQALVKIMKDEPYNAAVTRPHWDYIFSGRMVEISHGETVQWVDIFNTDEILGTGDNNTFTRWEKLAAFQSRETYLHTFHLDYVNNLQYLSSWKPEMAGATTGVLLSVLDYAVSLFSSSIKDSFAEGTDLSSFSALVDALLAQKVFTPDLMIKLLDLLANVYTYLPDDILGVINALLTDNAEDGAIVDMFAWRDAGYIVEDYPWKEDGTQDTTKDKVWQANRNYDWFVEGSGSYIEDKTTFMNAINALLEPAGTLFSLIFLGEDYNLLYSMPGIQGAGQDNPNYDNVVINSTNAYATALVPILEALGLDLYDPENGIDYRPEKYDNGDGTYNGSQFVEDLVTMIDTLFKDIIEGPKNITGVREGGPVAWLLANLPNLIYFINADGLKASIDNVFSAVNQVLDAVATVVDLPVDLHNIMESGLDLTNITFEGVFGMIYTLTKTYDEYGNVQPGLYMDGLYQNPNAVGGQFPLLDYVKTLYIGKLEPFTSVNGYQSFRMVYSSEEDVKDMVTVLLALALEYITDSGTFIDTVDSHGAPLEYNNAETLDRLLFKGSDMEGLIGQVIAALRNPQALDKIDIDWKYFDHSFDLSAVPEDHSVPVTPYAFQYLNWTTEWTYTKAETAAEEFDDLIFQALKMLVPSNPADIEPDSLIEKIKNADDLGDILSIDFIFSGDLLQKVLKFVSDLLYGEDSLLNADLIALIGYVLGGDLTQWDGDKYGFASVDALPAGAQVETVEDIAGLQLYYVENGEVEVPAVKDNDGNVITPATTKTVEKAYQIRSGNKNDFIAGLVKVLAPAKGILGWLLFGDNYTFFTAHDNSNEYLITLAGSYGYREGLVYLLEALGCDTYLKYSEAYLNGHTLEFVNDLAKSVAERAAAICADPANEIVALLPELIYFINAGGLQASVTGLLAGPLGLVNQIEALGPVLQNMLHLPETVTSVTDEDSKYALIEKTIDSLLKSVYAKQGYVVPMHDDGTTDVDFKLEGVNLKYIFNVLEVITGMEITDVIGNRLDLFAIGEIHAYDSKAGAIGEPAMGYKMVFGSDSSQGTNDSFADFVTILLSAVVDIIEYQDADHEYANAKALAKLLKLDESKEALVVAVAKLLKANLNPEILPIDWLYFDEDLSKYEPDGEGGLRLKATQPEILPNAMDDYPQAPINYLTYASDWSQDTAAYVYNNLGEIITAVLGMLPGMAGKTLADIISEKFTLADNVFTYTNYKAVTDAVSDLAGKIPEIVNTLLNIALELDLSSLGSLATLTEAEYNALDAAGRKNAFVSAIISIVTPLRPIVEWFFFNQKLEYFDKDLANSPQGGTGIEKLISIGGASAYNDALVPLLEAIGVQCPSYTVNASATAQQRNVAFGNFLSVLIEKTLMRVEEILADPTAAVTDVLPNLIYWLNTNALATVLNNLVAPFVALINEALPAIIALTSGDDLDDTMQSLKDAIEANHITAETTLKLTDVIKLVVSMLPAEEEEGEEPATAEPSILDFILDNVNVTKLDLVEILRLVEKVLASGLIKIEEKDDEDNTVTRVIQSNLKLVDVVGAEKIENFYLNDIEYFESASGKPAFRMPGSADMVTILINYLLEVLLYRNDGFSNAAELDKILDNGKETPDEMVTRIVNLIYGIKDIEEPEAVDLKWNYFNETQTLGDGITVPVSNFVYLNYNNQWTFEKAVYIDNGLKDVVKDILTIAGVEDGDISKLLDEKLPLSDYLNAETLNKILGAINGLFNGIGNLPEVLLNLIGLVLNVDVTAWDGSYDFVTEGTAAGTDHDLGYYESDGVRHYIINTAENFNDFASGLQLIIEPAQGLLGWLLLGDTMGFFVKNVNGNVQLNAETGEYEQMNDELIRVPGANGYDTGLVLLLEALGCKNLKAYTEYEDISELVKDVIVSVLNRIDEIMADPIEELLALIPEVIYFINANGLGAVVQNVASVLLAVVNEVLKSNLFDVGALGDDIMKFLTPNNDGTNLDGEPYNGTYKVDLDALMTSILKDLLGDKAPADFTFSFSSVDLQFVIDMVEIYTGLEIDEVTGYTLEKFIIGVVEKYTSVSTKFTDTYRVKFTPTVDDEENLIFDLGLKGQTRADMITILISLALDMLDKSSNVDAIVALVNGFIDDPEKQISADVINSIVTLLKGGNLDAMMDIDWFYFDPDQSIYTEDGVKKDPAPTVDYSTVIATPTRTINYIEYYTDWTEETAEYLVDNFNEIIAEVFNMVPGMAGKTVADLIAEKFTLDQLYNKDVFVKIVDAIQKLMDDYGKALVNTLALVIGGDLTKLAEIDTDTLDVSDKESFAATLTTVLEPVYTLLNWLLFGEDMKYFYDNEFYRDGGGDVEPDLYDNARHLINLTGAEGYKYGLVPLLEALGVDLPDASEVDKLVATENVEDSFLYKVIIAVLTRAEEILANPVDQLVALLPNLLYFINAGGLSASVFNLINAVYGLLPQIRSLLDTLGVDLVVNGTDFSSLDVNAIVNELLKDILPDDVTLDVTHLDLMAIVNVIEAATGLAIVPVVTKHNIRYFYFGKLESFPSTNGKVAFRMIYNGKEDKDAMITLLLNFVIEVLLYKDEANGIDNVAALEALLKLDDDNKDLVDTIIALITGDEDVYTYKYNEMKWNYFDETVTIKTEDPDHNITYNTALQVPTSQFIYLEYENDWTLPRADGIDKNLAYLVDGVISIIKPNGAHTLTELLDGYYEEFANDVIFTADNLNTILGFLQDFIYGEDAFLGTHLAELAGLALGGDITGWNYSYTFTDVSDTATYLTDDTGLRYTAESGIKEYAIGSAEDFANGLYLMLKPASHLLAWLLLGDSYNFFAKDQDASQTVTLINVPGSDGYGKGLALLLEALGVELTKTSADYNRDGAALLRDVIDLLVDRIEEIIADPVNEVLDLIPELIYFINANGLSVIVNNVTCVLLNIVNAVVDKFDLSALNVDILDAMMIDGKFDPVKYLEGYVTDLLNRYTYEHIDFTLDGVNTGWAVELIEALTDVQIMEVLGTDYPVSKFVLGTPTKYDSKSSFDVAYRIEFPETDKYNYRCDLITIVLSFAIEFLENTHNQVIIEDEFDLTAGLIADVLALVKERSIHITPDYDWFYFDEHASFNGTDITITTPERTINYLTYASDWNEDFADYLDDHLNAVIASVLKLAGKGDTTVADIIAGVFKMSDIYTVENLEKIRDAIKGLVEQLETLVSDAVGEGADNAFLADAIDLIFDIDIHAWDDMTFDAAVVGDKEGFASALAEIVAPISDILNWLFFGSSIRLFNRRHTDTGVVEDILVINGYDGYNEGLVPLLEALDVDLTDAVSTSSIEEKVEKIILATLTRAEAILANPVDEVLALLPEIFYFINANGLAASVNHLLGAPLSLVDGINALLADLGLELNINGYRNIDIDGILNSFLNDLLAEQLGDKTLVIDTKKLDLVEIVKIVELFTDLKLVDVVTETKLDNFYLGQIYSYPSANGKTLFKMGYTEEEQKDRADMITVLVNFLAEAALYEDNDAVIENLAGLDEGTIQMIIDALHTLSGEDYAYDWNYFWGVEGEPHAADAGYEAAFDRYATPDTQFGNYLTYKSDWTKSLANDLYENLDTIINSVLAMTGNEASTLGEIINKNFTLYKGEYLNKILDLVKKLYDVLDDTLIGVIDEFLDIDLTYWRSLSFDEEQTYTSTEFAAAVVEIVKPIYSVIDWLFFGKDITLFVDNAAGGPENGGYNLIVVDSVDAYATGLAPVLEALGVELPDYDGSQKCDTQVVFNGVTMDYFAAIVNAILGRVDAILADPIPEAFELLPELLYFVNANGLSTAVYNMLGGVIDVVNTLIDKGIISLDAANIQAYVLDQFNVDIDKLDLVGIFNIVENIEALHGLKLNDVFTEDFNGDGIEENILEYFYIGDYANAYISNVGNFKGYKLSLDEENKGDLLTMLLSVVLEVLLYDENEGPITEIIKSFKSDFTQESFHTIKLLLTTGIQTDPTMLNINWVYFWNYSEEELQAKIEEVLSAELNNLPAEPLERTKNALKYGGNEGVENLWNTGLREYLNQNLESIVDLAIAMATKNSDTPSNSLSDLLQNNLDLWTDDTANALLGYIKNALTKVDDVLVDTVGSLLGAGQLSTLKNTTAVGIESKEDFVDFFVETLSPLSTVLDFVLFGGEYKFFTHLDNGEPYTIILKGGEGYKYGVAPILAALGVDTDISEESTEVALREVLTKLTDRIDDILYGGDTINEALKLILNVIYFIDADGLSISVTNLLAPIDELLKEVNDELHIKDELSVNSLITAVDLSNLNFDFIFDLVMDKTGINVADPIGSYIKEFYFGATEYFTSYGDRGNFRMVYTEDENRIDMITILVTLLLDVVIYDGNHEALVGLVKKLMDTDNDTAEQYVDTIVALLLNKDYRVPMLPYKWAFTEYGDTGTVISAANGLTGDSIFGTGIYGPLYTREMGAYISRFLPLFIDTYLVLLGVKNENGDIYRNLEDLLKKLVGDSIYTNAILQKIGSAITGAVANIKESIGEEMFNHVVNVLNASLGVDLNDILYGRIATIEEGNEEQFIQAICDLLAPAAPILKWLLSDYDIALFNHDTVVNPTDTYNAGDDYIVLKGAEGYQNAVVPLLEALRAGDSTGIKTQAEYNELDGADMIKYILTPIFSRLDDILDDPINGVLNELPAVVYFLNSNGLDTAFKNLLNAVYSLLNAIEPITGEIDLYDLIGIRLDEVNVNTLLQKVIESLNVDQQFKLSDIIADAVVELSIGTVDSFTSVRLQPEYLKGTYDNGQANYNASGNAIDYTMHYSANGAGGDQVDYVTILMRLLLKFISIPQNVTAIENMLKGKLNDTGYKFLCSLLENFSQMASTDDGMDKIMYTVYYIFYAALNAGVATNNGLAEFNGNYSFLNQLFATSNVGFLRQLEISLGDLLNKYTPDIVDDDEVIPQGQISFWQKIINFFKKIGDFFKRLFGG